MQHVPYRVLGSCLNPPKGPASFARVTSGRTGGATSCRLNPPKGPASFASQKSGVCWQDLIRMSQSPEGSCQLCEGAIRTTEPVVVVAVSIPRRVLPALREYHRHGSARGRCMYVSIPRRVLPALRGRYSDDRTGRRSRGLNPPKGPASFARISSARVSPWPMYVCLNPPKGPASFARGWRLVGEAPVMSKSQSPEGSCQLCELRSSGDAITSSRQCLNPPKGPASFARKPKPQPTTPVPIVSIPRRVLPALRGKPYDLPPYSGKVMSQSPEGSCQLCESPEDGLHTGTSQLRSQSPEGSCQLCEQEGHPGFPGLRRRCLNPPKGPASFASSQGNAAPSSNTKRSQSPEGSCQLCERDRPFALWPKTKKSQSPEGSCQLCEYCPWRRGERGSGNVSIPRRVLPALRVSRFAVVVVVNLFSLNPPKGPASFASARWRGV